jgi:hypothetical protein
LTRPPLDPRRAVAAHPNRRKNSSALRRMAWSRHPLRRGRTTRSGFSRHRNFPPHQLLCHWMRTGHPSISRRPTLIPTSINQLAKRWYREVRPVMATRERHDVWFSIIASTLTPVAEAVRIVIDTSTMDLRFQPTSGSAGHPDMPRGSGRLRSAASPVVFARTAA